MAFLLETSVLEDSWDLVRLGAAPAAFLSPYFLPFLCFSPTVSLCTINFSSSFPPVAYNSVFSLSGSLSVYFIQCLFAFSVTHSFHLPDCSLSKFNFFYLFSILFLTLLIFSSNSFFIQSFSVHLSILFILVFSSNVAIREEKGPTWLSRGLFTPSTHFQTQLVLIR